MQHYKANEAKALKLYSRFLSEVLNNKEKAIEIGQFKHVTDNLNNNFEIEYEENFLEGNTIIYCAADQVNKINKKINIGQLWNDRENFI